MARFAMLACLPLAALLAFAAPSNAALVTDPAAPAAVASTLYENGGYCRATIHTSCYHETALGTCGLYVGGPDGHCVFYDGSLSTESATALPKPLEIGGYCDATIHLGCYHETAWGLCVLYVGGSRGACVIYEGGLASTQAATQQNLVDVGGECSAPVHLECGHYTALGICHVYVGGPAGSCLIYGSPLGTLVDTGGECSAWVHVGCDHSSALGVCVLYVGGPNGSCVIYEG